MEYALVAIVIGIIVLCGLWGKKCGLVRMVLSMVTTAVSLIVAGVLTSPVCGFIKDKFGIYDKVKDSIAQALGEVEIKEAVHVEKLELPSVIKDKILEGIDKIDMPIRDYVIESIANVALTAVVFMLLFVIASIIMGIIISMADIVAKLPVLSQLNSAAGLIAGLVYGIIVVWIGAVVVTACSSTSWANDILLIIGENKLLSFIYDTNPIMVILSNVISGL